MSGKFTTLYATTGRPSIPPEQLLRATRLQAFFSVRSERQLMEQINYNLLFRWFVGLDIDAAVWDASTFSKNRDRLLEADVAREFLTVLMSLSRVRRLLSSDHFSVDGTMIDAWASMKSFRPRDGSGDPPGPGRNGERDFRAEKRSNETHASTTDPDARLFRKTLIDRRTTRHDGYEISLRIRKRIEEAFGWAKTIGGIARLKVRGMARATAAFTFRMIAYNLIRLLKIIEATG